MAAIHNMTLHEVSRALDTRTLSSVEITQHYLARIKAEDPAIGAYLTVCADGAMAGARAADTRRAKGEALSPLDGVPMALKDNICTEGVRTTCASKMLRQFTPAYSATAAKRLQAQGAVLLGKLNMDEFAMGSSNEYSAFGPVKNPVDATRVPGGSSGGPAAAVAARCAPFALGSDTGGSIRQPAAFCGVVGLKPTYGRVSRYGLVAFASSLEQIGPLAPTVADCAMALQAICGHDPLDSTSAPDAVPDFSAGLHAGIQGMRIALPEELLGKGTSPAVKQAVLAAAKQAEALGAVVTPVSEPTLRHALPAYYVISSAEASSNLARFDGVRFGARAAAFDSIESLYLNTRSEGFGPEVKRRIMLGTFTLSAGYYDAYYQKALQVRALITQALARLFERCDLLLCPAAPTTAWRFGAKATPLEMYLGDACTVPANIAGLPALSLPCGKDADGLPIGLQLVGRAFGEATLLRAAAALEAALATGGPAL